jgi:hypothetical protein
VAARDIGDRPRRGEAPRQRAQRVPVQVQVLFEDGRGAWGAASIDRKAACCCVGEARISRYLRYGGQPNGAHRIEGQFRNTPVRHLNVILSA